MDKESRSIQTAAEWKLHYNAFMLIQKVLGLCQIDLFASWLNHQLQKYVTWKPDPFAVATDVSNSAGKIDWSMPFLHLPSLAGGAFRATE